MVNRPKNIGTAAETAVVRFLRDNGFPNAERRALRGTYDCGDVTGTPGVCWEVKGGQAAKTASDGQVAAWLTETETERVNASADFGILVLARAGIGSANAGRWWAVLDLADLVALSMRRRVVEPRRMFHAVRLPLAAATGLLRRAGYGDPILSAAAPSLEASCPDTCTMPDGHRHVRLTIPAQT